jgi:hypothetical protein
VPSRKHDLLCSLRAGFCKVLERGRIGAVDQGENRARKIASGEAEILANCQNLRFEPADE